MGSAGTPQHGVILYAIAGPTSPSSVGFCSVQLTSFLYPFSSCMVRTATLLSSSRGRSLRHGFTSFPEKSVLPGCACLRPALWNPWACIGEKELILSLVAAALTELSSSNRPRYNRSSDTRGRTETAFYTALLWRLLIEIDPSWEKQEVTEEEKRRRGSERERGQEHMCTLKTLIRSDESHWVPGPLQLQSLLSPSGVGLAIWKWFRSVITFGPQCLLVLY